MQIKVRPGLFRLISIFGTIILITACSSIAPNIEPTDRQLDSYQQQAAKLSQLQEWHVEGKIALNMNNKNNQGNLIWQQKQDSFDLLITGPLGQGYLHIESYPDQVIATTAEEQIQANSIEALFAQHFDWSLPMQELHYWVRGISSPNTQAQMTFFDNGDVDTIRQAGWNIDYDRYVEVDGLNLPYKLTITGNDIRLKLVLKNWTELGSLPN
ncbi:MAG: lipoprotein insertase outer membrane protein LolB [Pseudomonadales bacterium]|jgi:outer membrane lipoprotein LolB